MQDQLQDARHHNRPFSPLQEKFKAGLVLDARGFAYYSACKDFCKQSSRRHRMKRLRQGCAGLILTIALSASAFAGQVNCPGVTASSEPTAAGDILCLGITDMILVMLALV
jgi:hypothetical protein